MLRDFVVPGIIGLISAIFSYWYPRHYSRNDQWRERVDQQLKEHSTKLAVGDSIMNHIASDVTELRQDMKTLLLHVVGLKDGRRSDA